MLRNVMIIGIELVHQRIKFYFFNGFLNYYYLTKS